MQLRCKYEIPSQRTLFASSIALTWLRDVRSPSLGVGACQMASPLNNACNCDLTLSCLSFKQCVFSTDSGNSVFALCALPTAFIADFAEGRVWVLTVAALWWSLCVLFQGLSHNFTEILLARIGMGIGQAPVEALSISLISDMVSPKWLFLCER